MAEIDRIARLLESDSLRVRTAAAVVLGELKVKSPKVVAALLQMALGDDPALQIPALEALGRIGPAKALPKLMPLLAGGSEPVRRAAARAIIGVGSEAVPLIRQRMEEADPTERRYLADVLAELGGKDAFTTLLESFLTEDPDESRRAAILARQRLKEASGTERRSYLASARRFLDSARAKESTAATAAAVKLLGYLEDESTVEPLLAWATGKKNAPEVRQEALIALRFALGGAKGSGTIAAKVLEVVETAPAAVARTARDTLAFVELPGSLAKRVARLTEHRDPGIALFAVRSLGEMGGAAARAALVETLTAGDRAVVEAAVEMLSKAPKGAGDLARALLEIESADRAWFIARALRPLAAEVEARLRKQLLALAIARLEKADPAWEAPLDVARAADPEGVAKALREAAGRLKKGKKSEDAVRVLQLLARSELASEEDLYLLASLQLRGGSHDPRPGVRARDPALTVLEQLSRRPFDLGGALKKDRSLDLAALYYVGFHFVEEDHPLGEELLEHVVAKGGRTKLGKAAKNKLALARR